MIGKPDMAQVVGELDLTAEEAKRSDVLFCNQLTAQGPSSVNKIREVTYYQADHADARVPTDCR